MYYRGKQIAVRDCELFNLKDIWNILNYDASEIDEEKFYKISKLKKILTETDEEKQLLKFLIRYTEELSIFEFMRENNLSLPDDSVFLELWTSLYNKREILITPNLLLFINNSSGHSRDFKYLKKVFLMFLKYNNIRFEQIDYQHPKCQNYDYILDDIKNSDSRTLHFKKWILLSIDSFEEVVIVKSGYIEDFWFKFEKITTEYLKYLDNRKELNIFEFMRENNLSLSDHGVFLEIWAPLYYRKDILVTETLLEFMGFIDEVNVVPNLVPRSVNIKKKKFILFLKENNISYEQIDYQNSKCKDYNYILKDIQETDKRILHSKKWLIMTIDSFKECIMMLNNSKAKEVRRYYLNMEKIFFSYLEYIKDYNINLEKIKSVRLQEEVNQLKVTSSTIQNFIDNVKAKYKNGYIYIATTTRYASVNTFKIGKTDNLKSRLASYNSGRIQDDLIYYCFFEKVFNANKVENFIHNLLEDFKEQKNKENFILHYTYLKQLVKLVIKNINEPYEYINDLIKNKLITMYSLKPIIPEPLEIDERELLLKELETIVISTIDAFIKENKFNITRKEIIEKINKNHQDLVCCNKLDLWKTIKSTLNWQTNSIPISFKSCQLIVKY